ncbi:MULTISPECIES: YbdD/YjiX family protein [unclassified Sphingomonas]|jgi:uncharacterized short protein YbdD (DUF466 family)|uniref:YbdD/YjiX family protein n=1 Tax=unclassified Sphingomonas TaxID=196159 RepID=UPI0025F27627|nr:MULTISPECIES: YbdD/YjiX family protein [unclassified Sphingomonas]
MSVAGLWHGLAATGRLMVGVPSYRTYVEHMAATHPDQPVMSEAAFFRNRQEARYGGRNGGRCC